MNLGQLIRRPIIRLLMVGICLAFPLCIWAQVETSTSATHGTPSKQVTVEKGTVVYKGTNDLVVKMEDGQLRHFGNIPPSARVTVDGKQLGFADLQVGMTLQRTITTTTTPKMIKTVQTVTGKVWNVMPPNSVTLTMEDNKNQTFKIPKGQKFNVDGQEVDAFGLRKGMMVTATKVVEVPETVQTTTKSVTGEMPPPPPPLPPAQPILIVVEVPAPAPAPAPEPAPAPAPAALPKTGSYLPVVGLLGTLMLGMGLGVGVLRRIW